eukprot:2281717-Rhodomonas_salina.1
MSDWQYKAVPGYRGWLCPTQVPVYPVPGYPVWQGCYEVCATTILQDSSNPPSMTTPFPLYLQQYPDRHSL